MSKAYLHFVVQSCSGQLVGLRKEKRNQLRVMSYNLEKFTLIALIVVCGSLRKQSRTFSNAALLGRLECSESMNAEKCLLGQLLGSEALELFDDYQSQHLT